MSRIRSSDTKPELLLRKQLWGLGARGYRKYPKLPGRPDILFPSARLVIFVDGCFWHKCPLHFRSPKSNMEYWSSKIERNVERAVEKDIELHSLGYRVMHIWEHEIFDNPKSAARKIIGAIEEIKCGNFVEP